jgi:hypothetical protein
MPVYNVHSKEAMEITKDEDKTTYTIGSSEEKKDGMTEEERDKERAWEMLKNMGVIINKQGQGTTQGTQQGDQ